MPHSARYPLNIIESTKEINSAYLRVQDIHYIWLKAPRKSILHTLEFKISTTFYWKHQGNKFCMPHSARYPLHIIESTKGIISAYLRVKDIHYLLLKAPRKSILHTLEFKISTTFYWKHQGNQFCIP